MISRAEIEKGRNKFLINAKEPFLIMDAIEHIKSVVPEYQVIIARNIDTFTEACHRGALFESDSKIIVLWDLIPEVVSTVLDILRLSLNDIIVLVERKAIPKTKSYTEIKGECFPITLAPPNERECQIWVSSRAKKYGLICDIGFPGALIDKRGTSLGILDRELRKLSIIKDMKTVGTGDMKYVSDTKDVELYRFVDDFLHRRYTKAFTQFNKIDKNTYVKVAFTLIDQLLKLLKILSVKETTKSIEEVSELSGMNPFILKTKYYTILSVMGRNKIIKMINIFNEMDAELRRSPYSKELVMQSYLLKATKI